MKMNKWKPSKGGGAEVSKRQCKVITPETLEKRHGTGGVQRSHQRQLQQHHHTVKVWHGVLPPTTRKVKKGNAARPRTEWPERES